MSIKRMYSTPVVTFKIYGGFLAILLLSQDLQQVDFADNFRDGYTIFG